MKALWVVPSQVEELASGNDPEKALMGYGTASFRMRAAIAALEWKRGGHESVFWSPDSGRSCASIKWDGIKLCIVPKYFYNSPVEPWYQTCVYAKEQGCALVIDISDFPFARSGPVQSFYTDALKICDGVVVNSERMAELMGPRVSQQPVVIDDAILGAARNPDFAPAGRLRLFWFGHSANLRYLDLWVNSLVQFTREIPCRLTVMTEVGAGAEEVTQIIEGRYGPALEARFVEWSLDGMANALRRTDLVLIPSDPSDPQKAGVSANRIAETLRAGRFAIASPVPSYQAFADAAWLGEDVIAGIRWALANRIEVRARIRRGQTLVAERYTVERLGAQWRNLFESLVARRSS